MPQFAADLKKNGKGIIFVGNNYILGLIGNKDLDGFVTEMEAICKEASKKPVKVNKKADVKFDFKIKGQKPVVTKDIIQFNITGSDFNTVSEKLEALMTKNNVTEMEWLIFMFLLIKI